MDAGTLSDWWNSTRKNFSWNQGSTGTGGLEYTDVASLLQLSTKGIVSRASARREMEKKGKKLS